MPKFDEKISYISVSKAGEKILQSNYKDIENISDSITLCSSYRGLGVDRAVACRFLQNGIVVDAGSAITVDKIAANRHIGGFILIGIKAYKNIYKDISPSLDTKKDFDIDTSVLPIDTITAISYGIVQAVVQPIVNIAKNSTVYITGGDGEMLSKYIKNSIYIKDLVLDNLEKITKEKLC